MKTRLYVAGVLGGLAVLAVVGVLIFQFGRHDPSPPSLIDNPNRAIPGELLFQDEDGCFTRAAASGAAREEEVYCAAGPNFGGPGAVWVDANTIAFVSYNVVASPDGKGQPTLVEVDLATGKSTDTGRNVLPGLGGPFSATNVHGESVQSDQDGTVYLVKDGKRSEIASFDVPEYGGPQPLIWSPDGEWILLSYYPRRANGAELWLLSRDGQTAGTIASDVRFPAASWRIDGVGITPELVDVPAP